MTVRLIFKLIQVTAIQGNGVNSLPMNSKYRNNNIDIYFTSMNSGVQSNSLPLDKTYKMFRAQ